MTAKNIASIFAFAVIVGILALFLFWDSNTKNQSGNFPGRPQPDREIVSDESIKEISGGVLNGELDEYEELVFPNNTLDTSDWKVYSNNNFGFVFKYPSDWVVEDIESNRFVVRPKVKKDPNDDGGVYVTFSTLTIAETIKNINPYDKTLNRKVTVNGIQGIVIDYKLGVWSEDRGPDQRETYQSYLFDTGEHRIGFYEPSADSFRTDVLEQLVLSFKVIK